MSLFRTRSPAHSSVSCLLLAGAFLATTASADDLRPPGWRGGANTTFQQWTFPVPPLVVFQDPDPGAVNPGAFNFMFVPNPNPPSTEWLPDFTGRAGVWRLDDLDAAKMVFGVGNHDVGPLHKVLQIQVTYFDVTGSEAVSIPTGPDYVAGVELLVLRNSIGHGWNHATHWFSMDACPDLEEIHVEPPPGGVVYLDQVVIDTICVAENEIPNFVPYPPAPTLGSRGSLALCLLLLGTAYYRFGGGSVGRTN